MWFRPPGHYFGLAAPTADEDTTQQNLEESMRNKHGFHHGVTLARQTQLSLHGDLRVSMESPEKARVGGGPRSGTSLGDPCGHPALDSYCVGLGTVRQTRGGSGPPVGPLCS